MPAQRRPKVLIVEGDENHRLLYAACLRMAGYRVSVAMTGLQAIELARKVKPDIILLDVDRPEKNGPDIVTSIRTKHPHVPIIVSSGYTHFCANVRFRAADAFMVKSSNVEELEKKIKELLDRRNLFASFTRPGDLESRADFDA